MVQTAGRVISLVLWCMISSRVDISWTVNAKSLVSPENTINEVNPDEPEPENNGTDQFGLSDDEYFRTKEKAKQFRIRYAQAHGEQVPEEPMLSYMLFGDLLYTEDQLNWFMSRLPHGQHSRRKRKIVNHAINPTMKWPGAIPYVFSDGHPHGRHSKLYIKEGITIWEEQTCVRFKEIQQSDISQHRDYVSVESRNGCYANYGRIGGRQVVGLGPKCLTNDGGHGYVVHELGHALGVYHEHSRYDRDSYVRITKENIRKGAVQNFATYGPRDITTLGLPYDLTSVMHYGSEAFSSHTGMKSTIETLDPLYRMTIGQRYGPSFLDVKTINLAYCSRVCGSSSIPCQRDGYPDPNWCSWCKCPEGYQGQYCQDLVPSTPSVCTISGEIGARRQTGCITVKTSKPRASCTWLLKAQTGCHVEFWFDGKFDVLAGRTAGPTCFHYVEVHYKDRPQKPGPRFCGHHDMSSFEKLTSDQNEILVNFRSSHAPLRLYHQVIFTMCYRMVGTCSHEAPAKVTANTIYGHTNTPHRANTKPPTSTRPTPPLWSLGRPTRSTAPPISKSREDIRSGSTTIPYNSRPQGSTRPGYSKPLGSTRSGYTKPAGSTLSGYLTGYSVSHRSQPKRTDRPIVITAGYPWYRPWRTTIGAWGRT